MKILVTGASGFVGTHLCEKLLNEGHQVFALIRNETKFNLNHTNLFKIKIDLSLNLDNLLTNLPNDLDLCIHTAGLVHSFLTEEFFEINAQATKKLINELKKKYPDNFQFILISSLAASGPSEVGNKKSHLDMDLPISDYGRSKKEAELHLRDLAPKSWQIKIIRPPMVIGPNDPAVLDIFKMVKDGIVLLPGTDSLNKEYSFVCVFDLVETINKSIYLKESILLYSTYPDHTNFKNLIEEIKTQMNKKKIVYIKAPYFLIRTLSLLLWFIYRFIYRHNLRLTPDKYHELKAKSWTCDSSLSIEKLSQNYNYDLNRTIQITLSDYKKRGWI